MLSDKESAAGSRSLRNKQEKERKRMRTYELEKVETYSIRARNVDEAMEILNGLDNSAAYRVNVRVIYTSAPTEKEEANA